MAGDALRNVHGLTSCRCLFVDDLLIVCAYLIDQTLFGRRGGLGSCGSSTGLLAGRQSLSQIFDHLVELFV
jgi:hypothetical protein